MSSNSTSPGAGAGTLGWVPSPVSRGTFDIITSCLQTIALCAWVSVCINLPAAERRTWDYLRDKFHFVLLTLGGPELVFMLAFGQYHSASRSVKLFAELGYPEWTLMHGFYADMGGITVRPRGWKSFPVNAEQVCYLVRKGYMAYPSIKRVDINARAKSDGLARLITIIQTIYFVVTTLARLGQGLAITTMELTVLGFIFCTLATTICWWHKPCDVEDGHFFELKVSIDEILLQAGDSAAEIYHDTPLDFVSHNQLWYGNLIWRFFVNILRHLHVLAAQSKPRPVQKISSFNFPKINSMRSEVLVLVISLAYCSSFCFAWNMHFPSTIERDLWRTVAVTQFVLCFGGVFEMVFFQTHANIVAQERDRRGGKNADLEKDSLQHRRRTPWSLLWSKPCNNGALKLPTYDIPMRSVLITTPVGALYVVCRWCILLEDVIGLRSLPASAFVMVEWTRYWPSF